VYSVFVKETIEGDRYGVIDPSRWTDASFWLLNNRGIKHNYGLNSLLWQPPRQLLAGSERYWKKLRLLKLHARESTIATQH
jgi:hypothetical protein